MKNQLSILTTQDFVESFEGDNVRRKWHKGKWWFAIADVCGVLADTEHGETYWRKLKTRDEELSDFQSRPVWAELKVISKDGKSRKTECANLEGILRIIQSIPSPKAEPFKKWLAQVGNERVEEMRDPSKSIERGIEQYKKLGRDNAWIKNRIQGITDRKELTSDWQQRGIVDGHNYARLTDDMHNQAFGMKTSQHKEIKGLTSQNLRNHMSRYELLVSNAMELATLGLHEKNNSYGLQELREDAIKGGRVARDLRENLEKTLGRSIITSNNYLTNKD